MAAVFRDHPEVLERTLEIAAKIDLFPITRKPVTPQFPVPSGPHPGELLPGGGPAQLRGAAPGMPGALAARACSSTPRTSTAPGWSSSWTPSSSMGFPGYFLLVWDFIRKAREMGVPVGPGRGSAAGSIVAWSMHITDIDPMQYDLLFERFLNPERISMPDVDIDFCRDGRQKVIDYVTETYGKDRVSNIVTINQLKTKAVIKDVARVFEKDFAFANNLTKLVPQEPGKPITVAEALEQSDKLRELYETDPEVKNILDISARLEGLARNTGDPRRRRHHRPGRPHHLRPAVPGQGRQGDGAVLHDRRRAGRPAEDGLPGPGDPHPDRQDPGLHRQDPRPAPGHD